jgi:hypothetical protein
MSQRAAIAGTTAAGTAALVPEIPALGVFDALGPLGKIALGGAIAWMTYSMTGATGAVAMGLGIGLAIDGLIDLTLGPAMQKVSK